MPLLKLKILLLLTYIYIFKCDLFLKFFKFLVYEVYEYFYILFKTEILNRLIIFCFIIMKVFPCSLCKKYLKFFTNNYGIIIALIGKLEYVPIIN